MESCIKYWESQGIDPFEAITSVGCKSIEASAGHDVFGGFLFFGLLVLACVIAEKTDQL